MASLNHSDEISAELCADQSAGQSAAENKTAAHSDAENAIVNTEGEQRGTDGGDVDEMEIEANHEDSAQLVPDSDEDRTSDCDTSNDNAQLLPKQHSSSKKKTSKAAVTDPSCVSGNGNILHQSPEARPESHTSDALLGSPAGGVDGPRDPLLGSPAGGLGDYGAINVQVLSPEASRNRILALGLDPSDGDEQNRNEKSEEAELRKDLKAFLDTARKRFERAEGWREKLGAICWPPHTVFQTGKTILVIALISLYGRIAYDHMDFISNSAESFRHLYFQNWTNLEYTKAYALYSKPEFFQHINYVLTQFNWTNKYAIGPYDFFTGGQEEGSRREPMLTITSYENLVLFPSTYTVPKHFKGRKVNETIEVLPVNKTVPGTNKTEKIYDLEEFLEQNNIPLNFNNVTQVQLDLMLTTVHVGVWKPEIQHSKEGSFECYDFLVSITYCNQHDNGQLTIDLDVDAESHSCNNDSDKASMDGIPAIICCFVLVLAASSVFTVIYMVVNTHMLKKKTKGFFERNKVTLDAKELRVFRNLWNWIIIVADLMLIIGAIFQLNLALRRHASSTLLFDLCSMTLGTGSLLCVISLIRDIDIISHQCHILIHTLQNAIYPRILMFLWCVILLYAGFMFAGWLVLGPYTSKFSGIDRTSQTIFALINGDDVFTTFAQLDDAPIWIQIYGNAYLYIFLSMFIYVVINVCISILTDAYTEITNYYREGFPKTKIEEFVDGTLQIGNIQGTNTNTANQQQQQQQQQQQGASSGARAENPEVSTGDSSVAMNSFPV